MCVFACVCVYAYTHMCASASTCVCECTCTCTPFQLVDRASRDTWSYTKAGTHCWSSQFEHTSTRVRSHTLTATRLDQYRARRNTWSYNSTRSFSSSRTMRRRGSLRTAWSAASRRRTKKEMTCVCIEPW